MKILSDLKDFIAAHRGGPLLLGRQSRHNETDEEPMLTAFYNELWDYSGTEEDHLAAALYGPGSSRKLNAYKKLKQRALEDLSGQIILVGSNSSVFTPDQRGFYRAHREYVVAELLRARNFKDSAAYFHRRALSKARKYQIISLQVLCLEALAYHAGVQDRNLRLLDLFWYDNQPFVRL